ncbi:MAG: hypothetical protein P4M05_03455 [Bradyrhizobium sp.]|nr:hypothetical protein [Bradyrhizobium sp.]
MAVGWKFKVRRKQHSGGAPSEAWFVVALSDRMGAELKLMSKEKILDEEIKETGEADQALLDQWNVKSGEVFCVMAWHVPSQTP